MDIFFIKFSTMFHLGIPDLKCVQPKQSCDKQQSNDVVVKTFHLGLLWVLLEILPSLWVLLDPVRMQVMSPSGDLSFTPWLIHSGRLLACAAGITGCLTSAPSAS